MTARRLFSEFGKRIGLPPKLVDKELDNLAEHKPLVEELIRASLLSEPLKQHYLLSFNYRRLTLSQ